jgi:aerobic-type carbon monoxide dehydrogenase small subunit (CoxS/CutS family)
MTDIQNTDSFSQSVVTQLSVNGVAVTVGDHPHLMSALRDELNIISLKDGCAPSGQCGCCTVLIDGKARVSCQTSVEKSVGKEITTLEGLPDEERCSADSARPASSCVRRR